MSAFHDLGESNALQIWDGVHGRVVEGERITLVLVELDPDAVVPTHSHPNEQLGILFEGSAEFTVGDERRTVEPGGSWRILGGVPHEVRAGPEGAVLIESFSPIRDDWAGLGPSTAPRRWPR
jgi:quercetin dioxygenase-like cupin family protein